MYVVQLVFFFKINYGRLYEIAVPLCCITICEYEFGKHVGLSVSWDAVCFLMELCRGNQQV